jgi:hypothetical protein
MRGRYLFVSCSLQTMISRILPLIRHEPSFMLVPVANESEGVSSLVLLLAARPMTPASYLPEGSTAPPRPRCGIVERDKIKMVI